MYKSQMIIVAALALVAVALAQHGHGHGHYEHVDYYAYPKYEFAYGVEDHHTGDSKGQKESRDGDKVSGEYTLKEPGGNLRIVKYESDKKDGFYAHVINKGGNDHSGGKHSHGKAFSYQHFSGPVVGHATEIHVQGHGGGHGGDGGSGGSGGHGGNGGGGGGYGGHSGFGGGNGGYGGHGY